MLDTARLVARKAGLKIRTSLIRTRSPGAAIVDEAKRRGSDVIYLSTVHAPPAEDKLGSTATYLLERRPCLIVVETAPNGRLNGAGLKPSREPLERAVKAPA